MRAPSLSILFLLAVGCGSGGDDGKPERAHGEVTDYTWKDWDVLQYREGYRVINNVWNKQAAEAPPTASTGRRSTSTSTPTTATSSRRRGGRTSPSCPMTAVAGRPPSSTAPSA